MTGRLAIILLATLATAGHLHADEKQRSGAFRVKPKESVGLNTYIRQQTQAATPIGSGQDRFKKSQPRHNEQPRSIARKHNRHYSTHHAGYSRSRGRSYGSVGISTGYRHNGVRIGFGLGYNTGCGNWGVSYGYSAPLWRYSSSRYSSPTTVHVVNPYYYEPDVVYGWRPTTQRGFTPQEKIVLEYPAAPSAVAQTDLGGDLADGWARLAAGRPGEASLIFAKDAEADETDIGSWVGLSMALASQDDLRESAWAMRKALERSGGAVNALPDNAALRLRARSLVDRFMGIVSIDESNADALLMVGAFAAMGGNTQLGYDSARAAHEAEPDQATKNLLDRLAPPDPEPVDEADAPTETGPAESPGDEETE